MKILTLILSLNETLDRFFMVDSMHLYGHVLNSLESLVLRRALWFDG